MTYLGIESGHIRIEAIIPPKPDNEEVYAKDIHTENIIRDIEQFKQVELDNMYGSDYSDLLHHLDNQPWIVYKYINTADPDYYEVLPLDLFVDHTMIY